MPASRAIIYYSARTVHLERLSSESNVSFFYCKQNYDFDELLARQIGARKLTPLGICKQLLEKKFDFVEITEPLYLEALPNACLFIITCFLGKLFFDLKSVLVAYAIENLSLTELLRGLPLRYRPASPLIRVLAQWAMRSLDRIAFGTKSSLDAYVRSGLPSKDGPQISLFPATEPQCPSCDIQQKSLSVIFVGSFEHRKGIEDLLACWPSVLAQSPEAELILIGKGTLLGEIKKWVGKQPSAELIVDPPRQTIHAKLASAKVLTLPSRRLPRWKEQIGLPILEGLSHGCEIVSTTETGIADWLIENGHHAVIPGDVSSLGKAILSALDSTRTPNEIVADLPSDSGRTLAGNWLLHGKTSLADDDYFMHPELT